MAKRDPFLIDLKEMRLPLSEYAHEDYRDLTKQIQYILKRYIKHRKDVERKKATLSEKSPKNDYERITHR